MDAMDGTAFFAHGLRDIPITALETGEGICDVHQRTAMLYDVGQKRRVCRGCILLRQAYPASGEKGGKTRLGLGCYMLITTETTQYWGKHHLPPSIPVHVASGALRALVRKLILTPPDPPWMFVAFARSNSPARLNVTTSNDLLHFSGKFFIPGTVDEPMVDRLHRNRVLALHHPEMTSDDWHKLARKSAELNHSLEALAYLREIYAKYPHLTKYPVPAERTPEYNALRLLAMSAEENLRHTTNLRRQTA